MDTTSLMRHHFLKKGIVDSLSIMELVAFLEDKFHISVEDHEITPGNFDSVNKLAEYIQSKSVES